MNVVFLEKTQLLVLHVREPARREALLVVDAGGPPEWDNAKFEAEFERVVKALRTEGTQEEPPEAKL